MHLLRQSTAATVLVGPVLDSTGAAYTGATSADLNVTKNGTTAVLSADDAAATVTHSHNGLYLVALTATNTATAGRFALSLNKSTYVMAAFRFEVLQGVVFDLWLGGTAPSTYAGGAVASVTGNVGGNVVGSVGSVTGAVTLPAIPTDWIAAAGVKADAVTKLQAGLSTYAGGDTTGTATLLTRVPGVVQPQTGDGYARLGAAGAGLTALGDARLANLDAAVSTRSTYAGGAVASVTGNVGGNVVGSVGSVTGAVTLPAIPTDWIAAEGVRADAVTKVQAGLSTYGGGDTTGTTTLLARVPGTVQPQTGDSYARLGPAGAGLTALGDARLAYLDAAVSSRATAGDGDPWGGVITAGQAGAALRAWAAVTLGNAADSADHRRTTFTDFFDGVTVRVVSVNPDGLARVVTVFGD